MMRSPFHMVEMSPWPILGSFSALLLAVGFVDWFSSGTLWSIGCGVLPMLLVMYQWWRDVVRESDQGWHTSYVAKNIRMGMALFIVSEVFFFFGFFWAFFSSSLVPSVEVGGVWPPVGIQTLNALKVPLLGTAVLLLTGVTVTWAHHAVLARKREEALLGLGFTVLWGFYFMVLQLLEYFRSTFTIADGIYGSLFYVMTGFHGIHVLIGVVFLSVCAWRCLNFGFSSGRHLGLDAAVWYWHFVDVVWITVFLCVYWWGGS
uniref:Cytochrome c oxidase subunit 3 n=1 Tax=Margaritifera margaritifera TaxID=2505931 RepID=A0A4Y5QSG6_9BIVA|nr:cytochrome c oxidase subunit 3 [Margaritifera margaritifera]